MRYIVCILAFTIPLTAFAAAGEAGFDLLRRDFNPASIAIGSADVAFPQPTAVGGNPASLADNTRRIASAGYVNDPLDLKSGFLHYTQPWKGFVVGGRILYSDYGTFDRTSTTGERLGTFGANDVFIGIAAARKFDEFAVGIEPGYLMSKIDTYSATALTLSGGVQYAPPFLSLTRVGVDVRNLGVNTKKYVGSTTELPTDIRIGGSKRLAHLPVTLCVQMNKWRDTDWYFDAGGEFEITKLFLLRGGYSTIGADQKGSGTSDSIAGLSAGFGIQYSDYLFDFAYAMQGAIGDRLFLQFSWQPPSQR